MAWGGEEAKMRMELIRFINRLYKHLQTERQETKDGT